MATLETRLTNLERKQNAVNEKMVIVIHDVSATEGEIDAALEEVRQNGFTELIVALPKKKSAEKSS